ncbi:UDP-glucose 4-epimerase family protein [Halopseudomonas phragmitis]|uniref:NAD-dependent dehydratase n=1 Tax=Halopseudomonas phragmitis TaxID=1931241 RepID=A0A1V0B5T0_9GAMM|nr:SDR family oxidoreductase [Halopseudomonas phragmitis]AQZ95286.1 NAD-dependent dehydratase [Halopseudomonas phragmitis]
MKILLTGGNGLVGSALAKELWADGSRLACAARQPLGLSLEAEYFPIPDLATPVDWSAAVQDVDVVVHCAARVHVMHESVSDSLQAFRAVNVEATLALARQAASAGVRRFVFVSSIKVNGEYSPPGQPFTAQDKPNPCDPYAQSKWEAEQGLLALGRETGLEIVIVRPPLVYGPGVKANFERMLNWLNRGIPLPLGATNNLRSLVARDNLVDLLVTCVDHPAAANQVFLVSDGEDLSTTDLLRRLGSALGKPARLLPVPSRLLHWVATLLGKQDVASRLCGSLQVDMRKTCELLNWEPPVPVDDALAVVAQSYLDNMKK